MGDELPVIYLLNRGAVPTRLTDPLTVSSEVFAGELARIASTRPRICARTGPRDGTGKTTEQSRHRSIDDARAVFFACYQATVPAGCACDNWATPATIHPPTPGNTRMSRHHRPRKPFDWLGERKHRRGALELIRQAIREGWLDGNEHSDRRDWLVATLAGLLDIDPLPTAELMSVCKTFLAMTRSELDSELAALKAARAKCTADSRSRPV